MVVGSARGKVEFDCLECQVIFEDVESGVRGGADRLCPCQSNADGF